MNSLRHGLTGKTVVLPTEDPAQFAELLNNYVHDLKPGSAIEMDLVHELAVCRWRIQRMWNFETTAFEITLSRIEKKIDDEFINPTNWMKTALVFSAMADEGKSTQLAHRYEARLTRRFHQVLAELKTLQNQRKAEAVEAARENCETNSIKPAKPAQVIPFAPPKPSSGAPKSEPDASKPAAKSPEPLKPDQNRPGEAV